MISSPHQPPDLETPHTPGDSGLCCPHCEYNLTGLTENRCPECGLQFDPDELRRLLSGQPQPIPDWDGRHGPGLFLAFFRVCWTTWFHPIRFSRTFPWCVNPHSAMSFWFLTRVAAAGLVCGVAASGLLGDLSSSWERANLFAVICGGTSASLACEAVLVLLLRLLTRRRIRVQSEHGGSVSWWPFIGFHGSFLVVSGLTMPLYVLVVDQCFFDWPHQTWERVFWFVVCVHVAWWWYCLGRGVVERTRPSKARIIAILLIPAVGAGAILLGIYATIFFGFAIFVPFPR
ncbi:MAG: hypothetical protein KA354_19700 [Phycisphaerae bacterium]|nr:hypothetical protein [Phycisphaerae bacterium]